MPMWMITVLIDDPGMGRFPDDCFKNVEHVFPINNLHNEATNHGCTLTTLLKWE